MEENFVYRLKQQALSPTNLVRALEDSDTCLELDKSFVPEE